MRFKFEVYKDINILKDTQFNTKPNSKIKQIDENTFDSGLVEQEYEYLYMNNNKLKNENILISNEYIYKINLNGSTNIKEVLLFITTYSENKKICVESIPLNKDIIIYPSKEATNVKFSIRVLGCGKLEINNIKIYRKKNINILDDKVVEKLKLDEPKYMKDLNVAVICDEFTMNCFKYEFNAIKIYPDTWKFDIIDKKINLLFVESAWNGNGGSWNKKIATRSENNLVALKELTSWCKANNIPSVFWNKEDPVHFEAFKLASKNFDYVFTTDENSIDKYKSFLKHNNVYALPFAAQPRIHNPIKISAERINKAVFAGTYYTGKFEERQKDMDNILTAAVNTIGLDIYDRQYNEQNTPYKYPFQFQKYIKGSLNADELDLVNKGYRIMLNVNSVKDSNTMFSRRVFESLASFTPIISSYSTGIKNIFGELVMSCNDISDYEKEIKNLQQDLYYYEKAIKGMRFCLNNHTYEERLSYILSKTNINIKKYRKKVSLISIINEEIDIKKSIEIFKNQTYMDKELLLIFRDEILFNKYKNKNYNSVSVILCSQESQEKELFDSEYICFINNNNFYGKYYVEDLVNATKYTDADFIGKKTYFKVNSNKEIFIENDNNEFEYVDYLDIDKCMINKNVIMNNSLSKLISHVINKDLYLFKFGYRYFSIDKYNLVENLYESNIEVNKNTNINYNLFTLINNVINKNLYVSKFIDGYLSNDKYNSEDKFYDIEKNKKLIVEI